MILEHIGRLYGNKLDKTAKGWRKYYLFILWTIDPHNFRQGLKNRESICASKLESLVCVFKQAKSIAWFKADKWRRCFNHWKVWVWYPLSTCIRYNQISEDKLRVANNVNLISTCRNSKGALTHYFAALSGIRFTFCKCFKNYYFFIVQPHEAFIVWVTGLHRYLIALPARWFCCVMFASSCLPRMEAWLNMLLTLSCRIYSPVLLYHKQIDHFPLYSKNVEPPFV